MEGFRSEGITTDPKSGASANSATLATGFSILCLRFCDCNRSLHGESVPWPMQTVLLKVCRSLAKRTETVELLNQNSMGPVRFLHKARARCQSVCHKGLFVGIVFGLIANEDPVLG
jgi:hypothetical protein